MTIPLSRRELLQTVAAGTLVALPRAFAPAAGLRHTSTEAGCVTGEKTGAQALVEALQLEGTCVVFGIPGAQDNELWDTMKSRGLRYLLVTHEFSAAAMADGYARSTGKPGVLCIVPGPGVTNSLSGLGEALLDSVPVVCIVCDVARGEKYHPFQVHELPQVALLEQVTKGVFQVCNVCDIPALVHQAFALARSGEPGPVAVVVPYPLFIATCKFACAPPLGPSYPFDEEACRRALGLLANPKYRVGIYAGLGSMDYSPALVQAAELLQAPVATTVSGKGAMPDCHSLAVGWGYGPQGTRTAELAFKEVDLVLTLGARYSEVATGFYSIPKDPCVIQVDANPKNLGRVVKPAVCVASDVGVFLGRLLECGDQLRRPADGRLVAKIRGWKQEDCRTHAQLYAKCGVDPMALVLSLRRCTNPDALLFVDVTMSEHYAAEAYAVCQPRTYFNPTDNQAMGWSIPAALGAQAANPGRQVVTLTGDGCFLMSAMEISTAARECLPVKFFVLDDQAYHYMQTLQKQAYLRTNATILAHLDYAALARGFGVGYHEIGPGDDLDALVRGALCQPGPMLVRVITDYGKRPVRWINAVKKRYQDELTMQQKVRFLARIGTRALEMHPEND